MNLHSQAPLAFEFRRYLSNPSCPRCGDHMLAAEASALLRNGHIRHSWACGSCGEEFQTSVELAAMTDPPQPA